MLADVKPHLKALAAKTVWAYGPEDVVKKLKQCGVVPGTVLIVHSSWLQYNGFRGKPADLVKAFKTAVGPDGLLVMASMPYHNMSSAQWLAKGKPMNVRRSPSMMGLVSEVFRRSEGVVRSLSITHPLLAWGMAAEEFIAGHQDTDRSFGPDSPFAKLLNKDAIILGFDAAFSAFTFTHFVEDQIADTLPVPLYDPEPVQGTVVDSDGSPHEQWVRVLAAEANSLRREHRLVEKLKNDGVLHQGSIGHTSLTWIRARDVLAGARSLVAEGKHFFDAPDKNHR
jgi:aminoglycoside 3-N-acetyltransferase